MDHRAHERQRPSLHGLVTPSFRRAAAAVRAVLLVLVGCALLGGIAGGLLRAGVMLPFMATAPWAAQGALAHAALMICGFLGTVIGIERAVAVKAPAAFLAPLASGAGALCILLGSHQAGAWGIVLASLCFVAVNLVVVRRQRAAHTLLLLASAFAWLAGNLLFAAGMDATRVLPWWFAFLVMTIAAERLEMTRLMRRRPAAQLSLCAVLGAMVLAAAWTAFSPRWGGALFGMSLLALAQWLGIFDIARRTVFAHGLPRYMALCLLSGYAWLAVAGVAWTAAALGWPARDAALHALGLGFVVSMMMGHAPVILPAIARVKLQFGNIFYVPLGVLHLSLLLRLGGGLTDISLRAAGAGFNALAIALFAATVTGAAVAWRIMNGPPGTKRTK